MEENFKELTSIREVDYDGVDQLLWVTSDHGAFGSKTDGPLFDWIDGHETFISQVKQFDTVVQAGGNCGMYARFYSKYFRNVISFEPDPLNYYCLAQNCQGPQYRLFQGGLGEAPNKFSIKRLTQRNVGMHKIVEIPGEVQMHRLDDLRLDKCDLLHLDIEGYEEKALRGSIETIERHRPVIITERSSGENYLYEIGYKQFAKLKWDTVFVFDK